MEPRPVRPGDTDGVLTLIGEVLGEYGCVADLEGIDHHLRAPGPYFRERGGEFWVVEQRGQILATVAVMLHTNAAELKCLYVHRSIRRQGWGRRLTELAMDFARAAKRNRFVLWTDTRFEDAHRLYQRLGFQRCGIRDLHDISNTSEYGYELLLDSRDASGQ